MISGAIRKDQEAKYNLRVNAIAILLKVLDCEDINRSLSKREEKLKAIARKIWDDLEVEAYAERLQEDQLNRQKRPSAWPIHRKGP